LPFKTHLGVSASVMLKLRRHHFQNALAEHLNQQGKELILFIAPISGVSDTLASIRVVTQQGAPLLRRRSTTLDHILWSLSTGSPSLIR